jgi:hypothetical protein
MSDDTLDKINMVLGTFLLKDLYMALEGTGITIRQTTLAKIENALIEVSQ